MLGTPVSTVTIRTRSVILLRCPQHAAALCLLCTTAIRMPGVLLSKSLLSCAGEDCYRSPVQTLSASSVSGSFFSLFVLCVFCLSYFAVRWRLFFLASVHYCVSLAIVFTSISCFLTSFPYVCLYVSLSLCRFLFLALCLSSFPFSLSSVFPSFVLSFCLAFLFPLSFGFLSLSLSFRILSLCLAFFLLSFLLSFCLSVLVSFFLSLSCVLSFCLSFFPSVFCSFFLSVVLLFLSFWLSVSLSGYPRSFFDAHSVFLMSI